MKTVIIKLGGAAITNKKGLCELAPASTLDALMDQLHRAYEGLTAAGYQVILIHGAGSFGHPQALRYNLKKGWYAHSGLTTPPPTGSPDANDHDDQAARIREQKAGFAHTRKCVLELHLALLDRLQHKLPVLGISPFDYVETDSGDQSALSCFEAIARRTDQALSLGFVPMLHGDAVLDRTMGCTILSGDNVMHKLGMLIPSIVRCVFVTDVEGIFDIDPKAAAVTTQQRHPKLLKHIQINPETADKDLTKLGSAAKTKANRKLRRHESVVVVAASGGGVVDVTGGMAGKQKWARQIILDIADKFGRTDMQVVICKAGSPEAERAMALDPVLTDEHGPFPDQRMTVFTLARSASS